MSIYRLTWTTFTNQHLPSIDLIEDPIGSGYLAKETFLETFLSVLTGLDGRDMSSYVDFFFEKSSCNPAVLMFVDDDAKCDFRDEAIILGLIPPLDEIMSGESKIDELNRKECQTPNIQQTKQFFQIQKRIVLTESEKKTKLKSKL